MTDISRKSLTAFSSHLEAFDNDDDEDDDDVEPNDRKHQRSLFLDCTKHPCYWSNDETMNWFIENYPDCRLERCATLKGVDLLRLSAEDFEEIVPLRGYDVFAFFTRCLDSPISDLSSDLDLINNPENVEQQFTNLQPVQLQPVQLQPVQLPTIKLQPVQLPTVQLQPVQLPTVQLQAANYLCDKQHPQNSLQTKLSPNLERTSCESLDSHTTQVQSDSAHFKEKTSEDSCKTYTNLVTWSGGSVRNTRLHPSLTFALHETSTRPRDETQMDGDEGLENFVDRKAIKGNKNTSARSTPAVLKNKNLVDKPKNEKIRLFFFMRQLLENPNSNPSLVKWLDEKQGIFQIISGKSKCVAELWGQAKNNPKMTFEKLGRSLRWCRDRDQEFKRIPSYQNIPKKLCFRLSL